MSLERRKIPSPRSKRCIEGDYHGVMKEAKRRRRNSERQSWEERSTKGQGQGGFQGNPNRKKQNLTNTRLQHMSLFMLKPKVNPLLH